jgi:hypothetical protein
MRVSEGVPRGRFVRLYNPEIFHEYEEVIVFNRSEFQRTYASIEEQIDHINKKYLYLDRNDDWKLLGYWPKIMARVNLLDLNMDLIFKNEPLQCYLDAYLYSTIQSPEKEVVKTEKEVIRTGKVSDLDLLL